MGYCLESDVLDFFQLLNQGGVNYILIRNIDNELPKKLLLNKDIDLLVHENDAEKLRGLLKGNDWTQKRHPLGHFPFLYGIKPFQFYFKNGVNLDICYQLTCRSLNKGEWFPLDMQIQEDVWKNKLKTENQPWTYCLSLEDEFVHLMTRCVLDKKEFNMGYINRIEQLNEMSDRDSVYSKLELIFFKYSRILLEQVDNKEYESIISNYLQFKDY